MNTLEQADQLITQVCELYGFDRALLSRRNSFKPIRVIGKGKNKIDLASIRMALGLFLSTYSDINHDVIGPMCGYTDHTTLVYIRRKATHYIELQDVKFLPYWERICNIAENIGLTTRFIRIKPKKNKIMLDCGEINLVMSK